MTGQTVSHYKLVAKIGEGAGAEVYHAHDLSLGREVVLKFVASGGLDGLARFQHEARTISSLNHPNICTIYEIGEHEGWHFLAMEMLDGDVLARLIGRGPLATAQVIDLGTQIAEALDAAHAERIVHRDLKPANVFVTRSGLVKLLDFGVAVLLPKKAASYSAGRLTSSTAGTIPYMSPEQAQAEELDHRSDLFSLGVVLYEMATGQRPFVAPTGPGTLAAIATSTPVAPRVVNPRVPAELERIIAKALEKKPSLRYQSASDLKADLQRLKRDLDANPALTLPFQPPPVSRAPGPSLVGWRGSSHPGAGRHRLALRRRHDAIVDRSSRRPRALRRRLEQRGWCRSRRSSNLRAARRPRRAPRAAGVNGCLRRRPSTSSPSPGSRSTCVCTTRRLRR